MNQENKGEFGVYTLNAPDGERYASGFNISFDNGLELSIQFGLGTFSDNYHEITKEPYDGIFDNGIVVKAKAAEIAVFNEDGFFTEEIFGEDVLKYITPEELVEIMKKVAEWRPKE